MDRIRALVLKELSDIEEVFSDIAANNCGMFADLSEFLLNNSKRIRSILSLLYLKVQNVKIDSQIIDLLAAVELIHNASLLHDDVVDGSVLRRGVSTLFDKYGSKLSVISGDYILSIAVDKLMKLNSNEVLNLFVNTVKNMCEAEINQYFARNSDVTIEKYLNVVQGKTSSLFISSLRSCALLTGLDVETAERFGNYFGIIFQINNDNESESAYNDKKNGVKTAVDILGIEKTLALKDNYKEELRKILLNFPNNIYKQGLEDLIELL